MYCGDEVSAVVGDIGTTHARFGFAGEDTPKAFLPSKAGYQADQGVASASPGKGDAAAAAAATATANGAWSITDSELACRRDGLSIRPAVTGGVFSDWEVVEKLWTRAFEWLNVTNEHTVLSAESPWSTSAHRQQMMELMFETYNVPGLFIAKRCSSECICRAPRHAARGYACAPRLNPTSRPSSALAAFSVGRSTSMVVDCGGGGTSVVPVLDGYVLNKPIQRSHRGGEWLTEQVHNFLGKQSITVHPRYAVNRKRTRDGTLASDLAAFPKTHPSYVQRCRLEAVQGLKEAVCGLPLVRFSNQDLAAHLPVPGMPSTYELPVSSETTARVFHRDRLRPCPRMCLSSPAPPRRTSLFKYANHVLLQDGTPINLSPELFRVPEMLFDDDEHRSEQGPEKGTASSSSVAAGSAVAAASAAVPSSSSSQSPATPAGPHVALQKMVRFQLDLQPCGIAPLTHPPPNTHSLTRAHTRTRIG